MTSKVDDDDLFAAASRARDAGDLVGTVDLLERACAWSEASAAALEASDPGRALRLAAVAGDEHGATFAAAVAMAAARPEARQIAADLTARAHHRAAARVYAALGAHEEAARAHQAAGEVAEAAAAYDRGERPADAARLLETALRDDTRDDLDALRLALGELYARHGKHQASVRVLQRLEDPRPRRGLVLLARGLEHLGLRQARRDLDAQLERRGITAAEVAAAVADPRAPAGPLLFGRYRVEETVATTPHARLLRAHDTLGGDTVALKVLATQAVGTGRDALARFVREAEALGKLRHPHVVPFRAFIPEGPAMVLAWMEGGSLRELLDREPVSPARAAEIAGSVLSALAEAHRMGIVHRDVKPANLLFDGGGAARLADFGAAHLDSAQATVTVGAIGTVAYMAPEQRRGHAASVRSDLYAVGVLLHEMLTRRRPPDDPASIRLERAHIDLGAAHDAFLASLLAVEPAARPPDARTAQNALRALTWSPRLVDQPAPEERGAEAEKEGTATGPDAAPGRDDEARLARNASHPERARDRWLAREVVVLPWDELPRAGAIARLERRELPTVLRTDASTGEIWVEVPPGRPLSHGLSLPPGAREALVAALEALHREGFAHGAVDPDHVFLHAGQAQLAYGDPKGVDDDAGGSPEEDLAGLAALD
ncbi:MAG: protein kinase [Myxococcota bacterium]